MMMALDKKEVANAETQVEIVKAPKALIMAKNTAAKYMRTEELQFEQMQKEGDFSKPSKEERLKRVKLLDAQQQPVQHSSDYKYEPERNLALMVHK
jgi:hypothetical protein